MVFRVIIWLFILYTGETSAVFQSSGTTPVLMTSQKILVMVSIGPISCESCFKNLDSISSGPAALLGFKAYVNVFVYLLFLGLILIWN